MFSHLRHCSSCVGCHRSAGCSIALKSIVSHCTLSLIRFAVDSACFSVSMCKKLVVLFIWSPAYIRSLSNHSWSFSLTAGLLTVSGSSKSSQIIKSGRCPSNKLPLICPPLPTGLTIISSLLQVNRFIDLLMPARCLNLSSKYILFLMDCTRSFAIVSDLLIIMIK